MRLYVLVNHKFANIEYNYLCIDYQEMLRRQIEQLTLELSEIETLNANDIDGSYVACQPPEAEEDAVILRPFSAHFEDVLNFSDKRGDDNG